MAKKQTRRSISVSRTAYETLKAYCEANGISMSQAVEARITDITAGQPAVAATTGLPATSPAPMRAMSVPPPARPVQPAPVPRAVAAAPAPAPRPAPPPMTSAAARFAVEPPPPIIKKTDQPAPKAPAMPKADQIFTF